VVLRIDLDAEGRHHRPVSINDVGTAGNPGARNMKIRQPSKNALSLGLLFASSFPLFLSTSCEAPPAAAPSPVLTVMQTSVSIGDPHIASDSSNRLSLLFTIYEALVKLDEEGNVQPGLAERWDVGEDSRSWTFHLRPGVTFHNGEVLGASDVVATLGRVLDPSIGGSFGTQGVYISYLGTAEISAQDDLTVSIVTEEPMADLLDLLVAMPISPASELDKLPGEYVGSGPYKVTEQSSARVVVTAHDEYWGEPPEYREIHWIAQGDRERRVEAVLSGEADIVSGIGIEGWREITEGDGALAHEWHSGLAIIFMANAQEGPGRDRLVRQALNYALDVDEIIAEIKDGAAKRLNGYLTPHHFGYNPETPFYPYDPDMARSLLAEAGYPDGLRLVFDIPSAMPDEAPELARLMAEQYARVGITLEIVEHQDRAAYSEMVREKRINDAACFDSSPRSTYRVLREKLHSGLQGPWWEGYDNPEVNALIEEAEATFSDPERQALYREIYSIVRDDAPWIFLYRPTRYWGVSSKLKDWEPRADGLLIFS
jgi:peptide/nickel transport system substrate-binding protein